MNEQPTPVIKLVPVNKTEVPRPYTETTYVATEGIYALPTLDALFGALKEVYAAQGLEVTHVKPAEITIRQYHDHPTSYQPGTQTPAGDNSGQPADQ